MGCCETKDTGLVSIDQRIKDCIQSGNEHALKSLYKIAKVKDPNFSIDSFQYTIDENLAVTPLGYALLLGQPQEFKLILESFKGDFAKMEATFEEAKTSGLSVICLNNYLSLLQIYLPAYLSYKKSNRIKPFKGTLNLEEISNQSSMMISPLTSIQLACEAGHISILNYFRSFTANMPLIPPEMDLHFIEEGGDNCALIACKQNNFTMIKYLHVQCQADFQVINSYSENAINLLATGSRNIIADTLKCLEYLVEKVGVDPTYNYQESLLMLTDDACIAYLTSKLREHGINTTKDQLERETKIKAPVRTLCKAYDTGNRFTFVRMFPDLLKNDGESVSIRGSRLS